MDRASPPWRSCARAGCWKPSSHGLRASAVLFDPSPPFLYLRGVKKEVTPLPSPQKHQERGGELPLPHKDYVNCARIDGPRDSAHLDWMRRKQVRMAADSQSARERSSPQPHPLVGRKRELAELEAGILEACRGHGRLFLIAGEPGHRQDEAGRSSGRSGRRAGHAAAVGEGLGERRSTRLLALDPVAADTRRESGTFGARCGNRPERPLACPGPSGAQRPTFLGS